MNGSTVLTLSWPVPSGESKEGYIMDVIEWYYSNYTATGLQMILGSIHVTDVWLEGLF